MKIGFDSQRYYTGDRRETTQVRDYSSRRREKEESNGGRWSSSKRRRRDEYSRRHIPSLDFNFNYNRSSNRRTRDEESHYDRSSNKRRRKRRRREEESDNSRDDTYHGRSSNKRRREDVSLDIINYGWSSNRKKEDDSMSLNFHSRRSSYTIRREDSSIKNIRKDSCSGTSVIKDDVNLISSSSKCDDVSLKSCEDDEDEIDTSQVGSFPGFVDDGVVTEILSRLPVESLLRFKSVCKQWRSKITQDQHFIYLHSIRSKSHMKLLCIAPKPEIKETETRPQHILTADISVKRSNGEEGKVIIHNVMKTTDKNWFDYDDVLEQINGLVCFLDLRAAAVRIYNVSTREVTPWIRSTLLAEEKDKSESQDNPAEIERDSLPVYQIGFDPKKKEHKVVCFWRLSARPKDFTSDSVTIYSSWEALTIGRDTKWRRINVVPDENNLMKLNEVLHPHCMDRNPVHANGTIYWRNKLMNCHQVFVMDLAPIDPEVIIAFDIGSEKFRVIPIPSFIHDQTRGKKFDQPIAFLILGGRVTLIYQMSNYVVKLWMLDDDGVEKRLENCQGKGTSNWSTETITLPFSFCGRRFVGFHGSAAPDKILISQYSHSLSGSFGSCNIMSCLYSYDRKTGDFKKVDEMDGILPISLHNGLSLFTTFTESLIHVQPQEKKDQQLELVLSERAL